MLTALTCPHCGAAVPADAGAVFVCAYCGSTLEHNAGALRVLLASVDSIARHVATIADAPAQARARWAAAVAAARARARRAAVHMWLLAALGLLVLAAGVLIGADLRRADVAGAGIVAGAALLVPALWLDGQRRKFLDAARSLHDRAPF